MKRLILLLFSVFLFQNTYAQHHLLLREATPTIKQKAEDEVRELSKMLALGGEQRLLVRNALMVHEVQRQKVMATNWSPERKKKWLQRIDVRKTSELADILTRYQFNYYLQRKREIRKKHEKASESIYKERSLGPL